MAKYFGTKESIVDCHVRLAPEGTVPAREYNTTFPNIQRGRDIEMTVIINHMADCVLNRAKPWVDGRQGARVMATGLASWDSLRTGKPVKVRNGF